MDRRQDLIGESVVVRLLPTYVRVLSCRIVVSSSPNPNPNPTGFLHISLLHRCAFMDNNTPPLPLSLSVCKFRNVRLIDTRWWHTFVRGWIAQVRLQATHHICMETGESCKEQEMCQGSLCMGVRTNDFVHMCLLVTGVVGSWLGVTLF